MKRLWSYFNQNSYPIIGALTLLLDYRLTKPRKSKVRLALFMFQVISLVAGLLILRRGGSTVSSLEELQAAIGGGTPTLVEVFSNY